MRRVEPKRVALPKPLPNKLGATKSPEVGKGRSVCQKRTVGEPAKMVMAPREPKLMAGALVRWYDNGWRTGRLVNIGRTRAIVLYVGRKKRLPLNQLQPAS